MGALEFDGLAGEQIAYGQMLDELKETGYVGTELWGDMPTEPKALKAEIEPICKRSFSILERIEKVSDSPSLGKRTS